MQAEPVRGIGQADFLLEGTRVHRDGVRQGGNAASELAAGQVNGLIYIRHHDRLGQQTGSTHGESYPSSP